MSIAFLLANSNSGPSVTVNSSGANFLAACVSTFGTQAGAITDLIGGNSNTWTKLAIETSGGDAVSGIYYTWNPTFVGASHVITYGGVSEFAGIAVACFSGVKTSADPFDQQTKALDVSPGSITPAGAGELFIATSVHDGAAFNTMTESFGFTLPSNGRANYTLGVAECAQVWYYLNAGSGAVNPVFSLFGAANQACFIPSAAVTTSPSRLAMMGVS